MTPVTAVTSLSYWATEIRQERKNSSLLGSVLPGHTSTLSITQWAPVALSLGVKWPGNEFKHPYSSRAENKKRWSSISIPTQNCMSYTRKNLNYQFFVYACLQKLQLGTVSLLNYRLEQSAYWTTAWNSQLTELQLGTVSLLNYSLEQSAYWTTDWNS